MHVLAFNVVKETIVYLYISLVYPVRAVDNLIQLILTYHISSSGAGEFAGILAFVVGVAAFELTI